MQQRVFLAYAKGGDETIDCLPNRVPSPAQHPIVSGRLPRQVHTAHLEHCQLQQLALDVFGGELITNALQHFADNHILLAETLTIKLRMHPVCLRILDALEVIDPDRRENDSLVGLESGAVPDSG
jgi:hypothetical protein